MSSPAYTPATACRRWIIAAVALLTLGLTSLSWAQAIKGTLLGTVVDSQGAAVSGATLTIVETGTNISRTAQTNASGNYNFSNLKDGTYRVTTEKQGFHKLVRDGVVVAVNTTVRVDLALQVGELSEEVSVEAGTPLLQTDRADTGRLLESKQITEMPLGFNRNFQALLVTVPGATRPFRLHSSFFNSNDSLSTQVNGQSRMGNSVLLDGIDNNYKTGLLTVIIPSADAIETISVTTTNYDAEFGRAAGAVTAVTLKSGTNQFKGSAFAFGNSEGTQAKNYFSSPTATKPATKYQQLGAALGGPIIKDKLFFFGDYQRTVDNLGEVNIHDIPPLAFRNGDFSSATTTIYDPATGNADGSGRKPFPGNIIPASRISPIAKALLANLPAPNLNAALGQNNFEFDSTRERTTQALDAKLTFQGNENNSLAYRFSFQRPEVFDPGTFGIYGGPSNGGFAGTGTNKIFSTALNWTHAFGPGTILDVRAGMSYYHNVAVTQAAGLQTSQELGITGVNTDPFNDGLSTIEINSGYSNPLLGYAASMPWDRSERTIDLTATFTKVTGNHTIKVGFDARHNRDFLLQVQDNGGARGIFHFNAPQTASPTDTASQNGYANAFASFLLDLPSSVGRDLKIVDPGTRHEELFTFIQDKWQVTPQLTVDLGLRHEYYTPLVGLTEQGGLSNYDVATNTLHVAGYGDVPQDLGVKSTWGNFAPRLGLSYRINEKTVARAGFGVSIVPFPDNAYAFNFPVKQNNQFNAPNSFSAAGAMAAGFPAPIQAQIPANGIINANTPLLLKQGYNVVPLDLHEGRVQAFNVAFQRQLPGDFALEMAYVGSRGHDVLIRYDFNAGVIPGQDNAGRPQFAQFGRTASANGWVPVTNRFDSLQVKLDRRFSKGLLWTTSYTLSRAKDYGTDGATLASLNTPANQELSYGLADFDRTHNFVVSIVYELPFLRDASGVVGRVLGGWQVSGLFNWQSGLPTDITTSSATLKAPGNTQRPNLTGTQTVIGDIGPGKQYFDPTGYAAPAANTFGNMTRNSGPRGPAYKNLDASLVKKIKIGGSTDAQLRVDAFNVTNSPHFNLPNGSFGSPTFGQVNSSFGERLVRFGARVTF